MSSCLVYKGLSTTPVLASLLVPDLLIFTSSLNSNLGKRHHRALLFFTMMHYFDFVVM